jgi:hypothetical protein
VSRDHDLDLSPATRSGSEPEAAAKGFRALLHAHQAEAIASDARVEALAVVDDSQPQTLAVAQLDGNPARMPVTARVRDRLSHDAEKSLARGGIDLDRRVELEVELDADPTRDLAGLLGQRQVQRLVDRLGEGSDGAT